MAIIPRIVLTGASVAGKTDIITKLQEHFGQHVIFVPEIASQVIPMGYKELVKLDPAHWGDNLQKSIFTCQSQVEQAHMMVLKQSFARAIIFDRGTLDGAAYYHHGPEEFLRLTGLTKQEHYDRYDIVVYLTTLAHKTDGSYERLMSTNSSRIHDRPETLRADSVLKQVWKDHPGFVEFDSGNSIDEVYQNVVNYLEKILMVEKEYKFHIWAEYDIRDYVDDLGSEYITQGYTSKNVRIRKTEWAHPDKEASYCLTVKTGSPPERIEREQILDPALGQALLDSVPIIYKTRTTFEFLGMRFSVDNFLWKKEKLTLVEVEVNTYVSEAQVIQAMEELFDVDFENVTYQEEFTNYEIWKNICEKVN